MVVGVESVRAAARGGNLHLAIVAADASRHSRDKLVPLLKAKSVTLLIGPDAHDLGAMLGRSAIVVAGVIDRALASGIERVIESGPVSAQQE